MFIVNIAFLFSESSVPDQLTVFYLIKRSVTQEKMYSQHGQVWSTKNHLILYEHLLHSLNKYGMEFQLFL